MRSRIALTCLAVTAAALVGGCGDDDGGDGGGTAPKPETSSPTAEETPVDPQAEQAMKDAVRYLVQDNSGHFRTDIEWAKDQGLVQDGVYDLKRQSSRHTLDIVAPEGAAAIEYLHGPEDVWIRNAATPAERDAACWAHTDIEGYGQMLGTSVAGAIVGVPGPALVAVLGRGVQWKKEGTVLQGTSDLYGVAATAGKVASTLGISPDATEQVEVDFLLKNGRIVGWTSSLKRIVEAAERMGLVMPPDLADPDTYDDIAIEATLSEPGVPVTLEVPDANRVVELDPQDPTGTDAELKRCARS